ncbi:hypothetical protein OPV22_021504 [Ensete ventricosum]|uniref:RRM domain-containing protein n=1 Tax=Ensete ventricosum TaxID=4639 RepID=A0AAV8QH97_ENSVE|nr:hypothetical protein OPV22_021504 [Ensete ventricosum]
MAKKRKPPVQILEPSSSEEEEAAEEELEEVEEVEEEGSEDEEEEEEVEEEEEEVEVEVEEEDATKHQEEEKKVKSEEKEEEVEEEEADLLDRESIRKLLEPFGKDQLIELLKEAALRNPSLLSQIASAADSDPVHRKIFVHGLGWDATTEVLTAAFTPYGVIDECKVVTDRATGRCKGYGFVLFRTRAAAQRALREPQKKIGNRITSCQLASFGPPGAQGPAPEATGRKIFVSNIGEHVNPERLRAFFAKFGEIEEGPLGYDKTTGKLRGFAIFVYRTVEGCRKALEEPKKFFEGCELSCQRAVEGLKPKNQAIGGANVPAMLQPNDLALTYASQSLMGLNPMAGLVGQSLNPAVGLLGQNVGVGVLNQGPVAAGMSPSLSRSGMTPPPYGVGLGGLGGGGTGVNSISPSVIGSYQSQVALQGLGAYQNSYLSSSMGVRSKSDIGSLGNGLPPYFGR